MTYLNKIALKIYMLAVFIAALLTVHPIIEWLRSLIRNRYGRPLAPWEIVIRDISDGIVCISIYLFVFYFIQFLIHLKLIFGTLVKKQRELIAKKIESVLG